MYDDEYIIDRLRTVLKPDPVYVDELDFEEYEAPHDPFLAFFEFLCVYHKAIERAYEEAKMSICRDHGDKERIMNRNKLAFRFFSKFDEADCLCCKGKTIRKGDRILYLKKYGAIHENAGTCVTRSLQEGSDSQYHRGMNQRIVEIMLYEYDKNPVSELPAF